MDYESFNTLWYKLQVNEQLFPKRRNATFRAWCARSVAARKAMEKTIDEKGAPVGRNPYFWVIDFPEPKPNEVKGYRIEQLYSAGIPLVVAFADGKAGIYTKEDADDYGLQVIRQFKM